MRITAMSAKEMQELQLRLKSMDLRFCWKFCPAVDEVSGLIEFDRNAYGSIEFRDTHEIDQLIDILQRFKKESQRYFGVWD